MFNVDIAKIQKQLEREHKALDQKYKFIAELHAVMQKYGQSSADLLAILTESNAAPVPARRGQKAGGKVAAAPKGRKKQAKRPLRTFKHPKTGEITETRAPQVDKTIRRWAEELKVDWRTLEA